MERVQRRIWKERGCHFRRWQYPGCASSFRPSRSVHDVPYRLPYCLSGRGRNQRTCLFLSAQLQPDKLRHSIVHADSRAEWKYGRDRAVADEFKGTFGDVDLTDEQLKDATNKAIQQVKWYDEKM